MKSAFIQRLLVFACLTATSSTKIEIFSKKILHRFYIIQNSPVIYFDMYYQEALQEKNTNQK